MAVNPDAEWSQFSIEDDDALSGMAGYELSACGTKLHQFDQ